MGGICIKIIVKRVNYQGSSLDKIPAILQDFIKKRVDLKGISSDQIGLFLSYTDSNLTYYRKFLDFYENTGYRWGCPKSFPYTPTNSLASHLAIQLRIHGPVLMFYEDHFCWNALRFAKMQISLGRIRLAVVGFDQINEERAMYEFWSNYGLKKESDMLEQRSFVGIVIKKN